jgi:hypothetical protein
MMEVNMAGTAVPVDWPTLLRGQQQLRTQRNPGIDQTRNATWPFPSTAAVRNPETQSQSDRYLQLWHVLEWEMWSHSQVRGYLAAERTKVCELEAQVWNLSREIEQWRNACQQGYAALDQHRTENAELKRALAETRVCMWGDRALNSN